MDNLPEFFQGVIKDFRYGITLVSAFVLGLLLLFYREFSVFMQEIFIPSLAVYTLGTGLIAGIQILLTVSANTKAMADEKKPRGISENNLKGIIIVHICLFVLFIVYNIFRSFS